MTTDEYQDDYSTAVRRLTKELRTAAAGLNDDAARYLVDTYYDMQHDRIRAAGQIRAVETEPPNAVVSWLSSSFEILEEGIKSALNQYTLNHKMGSWMREVYGIGPVLSAGLLAHIYMGKWCSVCHGRNRADCKRRQEDKKFNVAPHGYQEEISLPTTGRIWQFAGIAGDDQKPWKQGEKRPHNARLKTLTWKVGQSFMKFSGSPKCYYGKLYQTQKTKYQTNNLAFQYRTKALMLSANVGRETEAWKSYSKGVLSPGHIDAMARRWVVKLFLAHMHDEWYSRVFGKAPPSPYPMAVLGHTHFIPARAAE
jgi:hypothetical protein